MHTGTVRTRLLRKELHKNGYFDLMHYTCLICNVNIRTIHHFQGHPEVLHEMNQIIDKRLADMERYSYIGKELK